MATEPLVSVVMSVYNGEKYLVEAIESILNQTFRDFEFIIIDDGSTDSTPQILEQYREADSRMHIYSQENRGLIASLNRGCKLAKGKYIARMDADDISFPERFAKQVDFLEAHPGVGVLGSAVRVIDGNGKSIHIWRFPSEHALITWNLCFSCPIAHPTVMMRREAVEYVGAYNADMLHAEDYDLWQRLSQVTHLANLQEVLLLLRRHEACITRAHRARQLETSIKISQMMMSNVLGQDVPIQVVERLWNEESTSTDHINQLVNLICSLFQSTITDNILSSAERRMIRRDAARQMARLVRQQACGGRVAWCVLIRACKWDPLVIGRAVARKLLRIARKWLR